MSAGAIVLGEDGSVGVLTTGDISVFDSLGECAECCGICLCDGFYPEALLSPEFFYWGDMVWGGECWSFRTFDSLTESFCEWDFVAAIGGVGNALYITLTYNKTAGTYVITAGSESGMVQTSYTSDTETMALSPIVCDEDGNLDFGPIDMYDIDDTGFETVLFTIQAPIAVLPDKPCECASGGSTTMDFHDLTDAIDYDIPFISFTESTCTWLWFLDGIADTVWWVNPGEEGSIRITVIKDCDETVLFETHMLIQYLADGNLSYTIDSRNWFWYPDYSCALTRLIVGLTTGKDEFDAAYCTVATQ